MDKSTLPIDKLYSIWYISVEGVGVRITGTPPFRVRRKNLRSLLEVVLYSAVFSSVPCSGVQLPRTLQLNTQARAADPYLHSHLHIA